MMFCENVQTQNLSVNKNRTKKLMSDEEKLECGKTNEIISMMKTYNHYNRPHII